MGPPGYTILSATWKAGTNNWIGIIKKTIVNNLINV